MIKYFFMITLYLPLAAIGLLSWYAWVALLWAAMDIFHGGLSFWNTYVLVWMTFGGLYYVSYVMGIVSMIRSFKKNQPLGWRAFLPLLHLLTFIAMWMFLSGVIGVMFG